MVGVIKSVDDVIKSADGVLFTLYDTDSQTEHKTGISRLILLQTSINAVKIGGGIFRLSVQNISERWGISSTARIFMGRYGTA